jgi:hypothetical protein
VQRHRSPKGISTRGRGRRTKKKQKRKLLIDLDHSLHFLLFAWVYHIIVCRQCHLAPKVRARALCSLLPPIKMHTRGRADNQSISCAAAIFRKAQGSCPLLR